MNMPFDLPRSDHRGKLSPVLRWFLCPIHVSCLSKAVAFFVVLAASISDAQEVGETVSELVTHLERTPPVTGIFVLEGKTDEVFANARNKQEREDAASKGLTYIAPPNMTRVKCKWSWDGKREMLQSLEDSTIWQSFYSTREALLDGAEPSNYNLMAAREPFIVRPINFYFAIGAEPLLNSLRNGKNDIRPPATDLYEAALVRESGALAVVSALDKKQTTIVVNRKPMGVLGLEWRVDDKVVRRMKINSMVNSQTDSFPLSARLETFNQKNGEVIYTVNLKTETVSFPRTAEELEKAFKFELAAGTEIYDLMLNKKIVLSSVTPVNDVIVGRVAAVSLDASRSNLSNPNMQQTSGVRKVLLWTTIVVFMILIGLVVRKRLSSTV